MFALEFYADEHGDEPVLRWLREDLTLVQRQAAGVALREILQVQGINVCRSGFGRQLGSGLFEFRLRYDAEEILHRVDKPARAVPKRERILLRVFCHAYGEQVILLLGGYDKGADPNPKRQQREIERARARLEDFRRRRQLNLG